MKIKSGEFVIKIFLFFFLPHVREPDNVQRETRLVPAVPTRDRLSFKWAVCLGQQSVRIASG